MDLQTQLTALAELIEQFEAMTDPAAAAQFWNAQVLPLMRTIALASGFGTKVVQEYVYRQLGFGLSGLATDAELSALGAMLARRQMGSFIKKAVTRAAASGLGPQDAMPVIALLLVGASLIGTAREASAAVNDLPEYQQYIRRYMEYCVKNSAVHHGVVKLPPPATFDQWQQRDKSGAWWQF